MSDREIASAVLGCVGGAANVVANSLCMTRLRITVANPLAINRTSLDLIDGVLGTATRGINGVEVVFGPKAVRGIFNEFSRLTGVSGDRDPQAGVRTHQSNLHVHISPGRRPGRTTLMTTCSTSRVFWRTSRQRKILSPTPPH